MLGKILTYDILKKEKQQKISFFPESRVWDAMQTASSGDKRQNCMSETICVNYQTIDLDMSLPFSLHVKQIDVASLYMREP